jgi:hypothetical protein
MPDDLTNRGSQDRSRINVHEAHEVIYWCQRFGCSEEMLRQCVQEVGVNALKVESCVKSKMTVTGGAHTR